MDRPINWRYYIIHHITTAGNLNRTVSTQVMVPVYDMLDFKIFGWKTRKEIMNYVEIE